MTRVIDLADSGVRLAAADGELLARSPGYALVSARRLLVGEDALRESRLDPRHVTSQFWQRLSMDPVQHPNPRARTQADLAHAHLLHLWESADGSDEEVLFAIPGHYGREQLALLLGIVRECPFRAVGLVDAAVAAIAGAHPDAERVLHVEALLHESVLTRVHGADDWQRDAVEDLPALGLVGLRDAWVNLIADAFIRETRFDPLHDAATEQRLFDRLDGWIGALAGQDELQLELEAGDHVYRVDVHRARMIDKVAPRYEALREALERMADGVPSAVLLGPELGRLPGLLEHLQAGGDGGLRVLEPHAAVRGALEHEASIRHDGEALRYVTRLPRSGPGPLARPAVRAPAPDDAGPAAGPVAPGSAASGASEADPVTHVLLGDVAWPLAGTSVALGGPDGVGGDAHPEPLATLVRRGDDWHLRTPNGREERLEPGSARALGAERVILSLIRVRP